jgi:hypothetical protein
MSDASAVNDQLPRPYAEEPTAALAPSGFRLVRAHPWSAAAAVLLTGFILAVYPTAMQALLESRAFNLNPVFFFLLLPVFAVIAVLPTVAPLTAVAILAKRRVTVGRVVGLLAASAVVVGAQSALLHVVQFDAAVGGEVPNRILSIGLNLLTLLVVGLLSMTIYSPSAGRNSVPSLLLGSVVMTLIVAAEQGFGGPAYETEVLAWTVGAVTGVGWALATLVTSPPALSPTSPSRVDSGAG